VLNFNDYEEKESIIVVEGSIVRDLEKSGPWWVPYLKKSQMAEAFRPGLNCQALRNNCFQLSECNYLVGRS
jgi:hypothetical protein